MANIKIASTWLQKCGCPTITPNGMTERDEDGWPVCKVCGEPYVKFNNTLEQRRTSATMTDQYERK